MPVTRMLVWVAPVALLAAFLICPGAPFGCCGSRSESTRTGSRSDWARRRRPVHRRASLATARREAGAGYEIRASRKSRCGRAPYRFRAPLSAGRHREDRDRDLEARPPDFRAREPRDRRSEIVPQRRLPPSPQSDEERRSRNQPARRGGDEGLVQARVPAGQLEPRENDVVYTDESKFSGKLTAQALRVNTSQFGDQQLKLADMRTLRSGAGVVAEELQNSPTAPANLMAFQQQYGKEMSFTVVGFTATGGQQASMWGTDVYTLDSHFAAAAVHAGVVKPGESAAVRVRIIQSPPQFVSSFRNGSTRLPPMALHNAGRVRVREEAI